MAGETKSAAKSKTIWLGLLQGLVGLASIAGLVGPMLGEKAVGWLLLVAGVAHVILRTVTNQPIQWRNTTAVALLALVFMPVAVQAQSIQVDTIQVEIMGQTVIVSITHAPPPNGVAFVVGDTITFRMTGTDEFGDPLNVTGTFISSDPASLDFIQQYGDSAQAVALAKDTVFVTATNIIYGTATALNIGWLDPDSLNAWVWPAERSPTMLAGEQIQFCAAMSFDSGLVGVGNTDECVVAYNNMNLARMVRGQTHLAFGLPAEIPMTVRRLRPTGTVLDRYIYETLPGDG